MRQLTQIENKALCSNIGKMVTFYDGLMNERTGWIQGANNHFGEFAYEVSEAKNPRSEFSLNGRWFLVTPVRIIL